MWPTTIIFMVLATSIIVFSVIMSHFANFNPVALQEKYKKDFAYSVHDNRELLTNACKLPYIFLSNDDVVDGVDDSREDCLPNTLNKLISLSPEGILTMGAKKEMGSAHLDPISGVSNQSFEIEEEKPVKVPFYNFAVTCKREGIVEFLKPLVNFAMLPTDNPGGSVSILYLPSMHHKLFMKTMRRTKRFMQEYEFIFAKMMTMKEPRPLQDLLHQLGVSSKNSTFQKAKQKNFSTYFSGPQQIRDLIDVDYDSVAHRNFVFQFLIDDKMCLEDGRRFSDDQLERFRGFLASTNGSKYFSVMFLDDYGMRKNDIDLELSEILIYLEQRGVFKNTTLIVASYDLSDKEVMIEDAKNPMFLIRLSDDLVKKNGRRRDVLKMNFNRLVTSSHVYHLISNLLDPNDTSRMSPLSSVQSTRSSCQNYGIPENLCLCMKSNTVSKFPTPSEKQFLAEVRLKFFEEVKAYDCVESVDIEEVPVFYEYFNTIKGDVRVVELSAKVKALGLNGRVKNLPVKKTFVFEPMFESFRSFDSARNMPLMNAIISINNPTENIKKRDVRVIETRSNYE